MPRRTVVGGALAACALSAVVAAAVAPARAAATASQAWPAFVLVSALLVIGALAAQDRLFAALGAQAARAPGGGVPLVLGLLCVVAVVTAVLNLDTSVVFLTPVLIYAARSRGLDETPFLYGAVFMSNAASLALPGSNLTNLIVLAREHVSGAVFAARMLPASVAAVGVTAAFVALVFRRSLGTSMRATAPPAKWQPGVGSLATVAAAVTILVLPRPAIPTLVIALVAAGWQIVHGRFSARTVADAVGPHVLLPVLGLVVALGTLARSWETLADVVTGIGRWPTAAVGALGAVVVNNLPAAAVLSAHPPTHPRALLLGLNLGPNLALSGSLSAVLWYRVARGLGCTPSARRYSRLGIALVPLSLAAVLGALSLFAPVGF